MKFPFMVFTTRKNAPKIIEANSSREAAEDFASRYGVNDTTVIKVVPYHVTRFRAKTGITLIRESSP